MKVFKFGGASVKNASAVRNVCEIIKRYPNDQLIVVVSAMDKNTNLLEEVLTYPERRDELLLKFETFHLTIAEELGIKATIEPKIQAEIQLLRSALDQLKDKQALYDAVVSKGELCSTLLIEAFLRSHEFNSTWLDAREVIKTDGSHKNAQVNWEKSAEAKHVIDTIFDHHRIIVSQGFIGQSDEGMTTTLGREGSDFSAAIFAFLAHAEDVTIWKDVPGMLNADPKWFDDTVKLNEISYREAIELAYYGASVIHPKTVKPLQNKSISLFVKSFQNPSLDGTVIKDRVGIDPLVPSYIFKPNQVLVSFSPKDFSFIAEHHLSEIFKFFSSEKVRVNLMQNSALNFIVILDQDQVNLEELQHYLSTNYIIKFNQNLELLTIRHYDDETVEKLTEKKKIFLEQKSRNTIRLVLA